MIALINSLPSGNAAIVMLNPPSTAVKWRLLRNLTGAFVDQNDSIIIYEGNDRLITATAALDNGVPVFYKPF